MMFIVVLTAVISAVCSACITFWLMNEQERREYELYGEKLNNLLLESKKAQNTAQNALNVVLFMGDTLAKNRDDLDEIKPTVQKLKQWAYGYVSYKPNLKGGDQK